MEERLEKILEQGKIEINSEVSELVGKISKIMEIEIKRSLKNDELSINFYNLESDLNELEDKFREATDGIVYRKQKEIIDDNKDLELRERMIYSNSIDNYKNNAWKIIDDILSKMNQYL